MDNQLSIISLPPEVLLHICSFLSYNDIKIVRLLNQNFNNLINLKFINKSSLKINEKLWADESFIDSLTDSLEFKNVKCYRIAFNNKKSNFDKLWRILQRTMMNLEIIYCSMDEKWLIDLADGINHLKHFRLSLTTEFNYIELIRRLSTKVKVCIIAPNCRSFVSPLNDLKLPAETTIEELHFECFDFDPIQNDMIPLLEANSLLKLLTRSLKYLSIPNDTFLNENERLKWYNRYDFNLQCFDLVVDISIDINIFKTIMKSLRRIKHLVICWEYSEKDNVFRKVLSESFANLKSYEMYCDKSHNASGFLMDVSQNNQLEKIYISDYKTMLVLDELYFTEHTHKFLKNLTLDCNFSDSIILSIVTELRNLKELSLTNHERPFPKKLLLLIFQHLKSLEELTIDTHYFFTDSDNHEDFQPEDVLLESDIDIGLLQKLRKVQFSAMKNYKEVAFDKLSKIPHLEEVSYKSISNPQITKADVLNLLSKCSKIKKIFLAGRGKKHHLISADDRNEICSMYPSKEFSLYK